MARTERVKRLFNEISAWETDELEEVQSDVEALLDCRREENQGNDNDGQ